ncbi:hypothetical protein QVD99_002523 [Batrachochytrium dendrobatidis]|nr:hypothetical protein QVD99_002523 [Batrachochytrium dendrobatidis]
MLNGCPTVALGSNHQKSRLCNSRLTINMFTKTSKQVLSPLAESVSALIVIISDSELNGTPIPDLSQLSLALESQLANLLNVATKIVEQQMADVQIKKDMPGACEEVSTTSKILVSSVKELKQNPVSNLGRTQLLEAVKGILSGTTHILQVVDDAQVRKILAASTVFRDHLSGLLNCPSKQSDDQLFQQKAKAYIQCVTQMSQRVVVLAQLASQRVGEILSDFMQQELQEAIKVLTKESPLVVSACKMVITQPGIETSASIMKSICEQLRDASLRIDEIVLWKGDEDHSTVINQISSHENAEKRRKAAMHMIVEPFSTLNVSESCQKIYQNYLVTCKESLKELQGSLSTIGVTKQTTFSYTLANELQTNISRLEELINNTKYSEFSTANKDAIDVEIKELMSSIDKGFTILETSVSRCLVGDLVSTIGTLSEPTRPGSLVSTMLLSAEAQDCVAMAESNRQFILANQKLGNLINHTLSATEHANPQQCQLVRLKTSRVEKLQCAVSLASDMVRVNPTDNISREHFKTIMASYVEAVRDLQAVVIMQEGIFSADNLVFGSKKAFDQQADALCADLAQGVKPEIMAHRLASLQAAASQFIAVAEKEKEYSEDVGYKSELDMKLNIVQTVFNGLVANVQTLMLQNVPVTADQMEGIHLVVENLTEQLSSLGSTVGSYKGGSDEVLIKPPPVSAAVISIESIAEVPVKSEDKDLECVNQQISTLMVAGPPVDSNRTSRPSRTSFVEDEALRALTKMVSETVVVNEIAPQMLTVEEAILNPIKAAGQELMVEASIWATENNPIIETVACMSQRMLDLSQHHQKLIYSGQNAGAKRLFIQSAQAILVDANTLLKVAQPLAESCTDRRLRIQLNGTLTHMTTLAQQLKIVAAVKASSPLDSDRDVQLISCAQNLMKSVKTGLRECVSCSLRVKKGAEGSVSGGIIKFRRVIYAENNS